MAPPTSATLSPAKTPTPEPVQDRAELDRVREIILGPDIVQQRLRKPEVDRLREILFGAQMEEYEHNFSDLRREMERVLTDLRQAQNSIGEFETAQTKRVEALEREIHRTHEEMRRDIERLRAQEPLLQQLLTQLRQQEMQGKTISEHSGELRDTLAQQERDLRTLRSAVGESREQSERKLDALRRELRQAEDGLRVELRRVADRLGDQKTDRRTLAAMLMEIATRLETGASVTGLLEGLTNAPEG
ncbi:MAG: hypothetical protein JW934_20285 [Anaerolineae bacterium]|nr:hypothetical protein [Anaerolineae bacterium]